MSNDQAIAQLTSLMGQAQNQVDALSAAIAVLTNGFQSDKAAIDAAASAAKSAADQKVADLKASVASALSLEVAQPVVTQ